MDISFFGLKNPANVSIEIPKLLGYKLNQPVYSRTEYIKMNYLNMELTDNFNGNDLTEYRNKLKASSIKYYRHPINKNAINIGILKGELAEDKGTYLFLNGSNIDIEDGNLPIISFIAKRLRELSESSQRVSIDKNFYTTDEAANSIVLGQDLRDDYQYMIEDPLPDLKNYHSYETVKNGSKEMFKLLNDLMMDYFK